MPENHFHLIESSPDDLRQYKQLLSEAQSSWRKLLSNPEPASITSLKQANSKRWVKLSSCLSKWLEIYTDLDLYGWKLYASLFEEQPFSNMLVALEILTPVYVDTIQNQSTNPKLGLVTQLISDNKGEATICMPIRLANLAGDISWMEFQQYQKNGTINKEIAGKNSQNTEQESEWNALKVLPDALTKLSQYAYEQSYSISCASVIQQINQCQKAMETIIGFSKNHFKKANQSNKATVPTDIVNNQRSEPPAVLNLNIENDEQALNQLNGLVYYYRATQPHSPVSYILETASQWLELSLPELLATIINDDDRLLTEVKYRMGLALSNGKKTVISYPVSSESSHLSSKENAPNSGNLSGENIEQSIAGEDIHHLSPNQELM